MRALQYKSQYINLRVLELATLESTPQQTSQVRPTILSIRKYRNANSSRGESVVNLDEKNRVTRLMGGDYDRNDHESIARCFNGKGSVADCQKAVQIFMALNITEHLQSYCDTYLGLDCSGFVNCYFNSNHGLTKKRIIDYYNRGRRHERINFQEFRNNDVLIWCDSHGDINDGSSRRRSRHIAVINSVREIATDEMRATVVESSGTIGLVHSNYTFVKTRESGVYRVFRPLKPDTNNHVKVVPVL